MAVPELHIGLDFDNTIVNYEEAFRSVGIDEGILPPGFQAGGKTVVRDYLRTEGRERDWTILQGMVYGRRIGEAPPFPGVQEFFDACALSGTKLSIISHRTRSPILGEEWDLHAAAWDWLQRQGFSGCNTTFFEETREAKIARIRETGCTFFVDDLPEVLLDPEFPQVVKRILFSPDASKAYSTSLTVAHSWVEVRHLTGV